MVVFRIVDRIIDELRIIFNVLRETEPPFPGPFHNPFRSLFHGPFHGWRSGCFRLLLVFVALPIVMCVGLWGYYYFIADFGRLTSFVSIAGPGEVSIPDTDWAIREDDSMFHQISLVNKTSRQQVEVLSSIAEEAFTTFKYQNRQYIVIRSYGGGTDGAYDYVVLDISGSAPRLIGSEHVCGNPRLKSDSLEFDHFSSKCDFYPYGGNIRTIVMKLD